TVEKLHEGNLFDDPTLAAGALGGFYVQAIAVVPNGAWPLALADHYAADAAHLSEYARMAATAEGFAAYLDVHAQRAARRLAGLPRRGAARRRHRRADIAGRATWRSATTRIRGYAFPARSARPTSITSCPR